MHRFQDLVNRIQYSRIQFSSDGEYLIGGSSADHNIYIWDKNMGNLVKILEGPNEALEDVVVRLALRKLKSNFECSGIRIGHWLHLYRLLVWSTFGQRIIRKTGVHLHPISRN